MCGLFHGAAKRQKSKKTAFFRYKNYRLIFIAFSKFSDNIQLKIQGDPEAVFSSNKLFDEKIRGISNVSKDDRQKND